MRKIERITSPPPTDHALFREASGYHLHYWHLNCTPWCCRPAPHLSSPPSFEFYSRIFTLCSSFLPDRFCTHLRRQRVYPVVFIHFCQVTLLLWPGKDIARRVFLSISRPPTPPAMCGLKPPAPPKPASGGTPPPLLTWGILPFIPLPVGE